MKSAGRTPRQVLLYAEQTEAEEAVQERRIKMDNAFAEAMWRAHGIERQEPMRDERPIVAKRIYAAPRSSGSSSMNYDA